MITENDAGLAYRTAKEIEKHVSANCAVDYLARMANAKMTEEKDEEKRGLSCHIHSMAWMFIYQLELKEKREKRRAARKKKPRK